MSVDYEIRYAPIAKAIATIAHLGQTDKAGKPYINHPRRVAEALPMQVGLDADHAQAVAWLHDVIEDTKFTRDDLHDAGICWPIILDVERLTRLPHQSAEEYYKEVSGSYVARRVKLADIADNTEPLRLALLDDETIARLTRKYAKARLLLGVVA